MVKAVFDTSALIPLALPRSLSTRLFDRLLDGGHVIVVSPSILEELEDKLLGSRSVRRWLAISDEDARAFLEWLPETCLVVSGEVEIHGEVPDDPDDDYILAAALEGGAQYVVTEDKHLLRLGTWRGIAIVTRAGLMAELDRLETTGTP